MPFLAWKNLETSLRDSLFTSIKNNIRLKQKSSKDCFRQKSENWKSQHSQYCGVRFPTRKVPFSNLDNEHISKMKYQLSPLTLWKLTWVTKRQLEALRNLAQSIIFKNASKSCHHYHPPFHHFLACINWCYFQKFLWLYFSSSFCLHHLDIQSPASAEHWQNTGEVNGAVESFSHSRERHWSTRVYRQETGTPGVMCMYICMLHNKIT